MTESEIETDVEKLRAITAQCREFAKEHVVECCHEMVEWTNTAILRQGRVRELSNMLKPVAGYAHLSVAEGYVRHAAFEFVVQQGKTNE